MYSWGNLPSSYQRPLCSGLAVTDWFKVHSISSSLLAFHTPVPGSGLFDGTCSTAFGELVRGTHPRLHAIDRHFGELGDVFGNLGDMHKRKGINQQTDSLSKADHAVAVGLLFQQALAPCDYR